MTELTHAQASGLADTMRTVANPVRLQLMAMLSRRPGRQVDLLAGLQLGGTWISQSMLSHHLHRLTAAGLASRERHGNVVTWRIEPAGLALVADFLRKAGAR